MIIMRKLEQELVISLPNERKIIGKDPLRKILKVPVLSLQERQAIKSLEVQYHHSDSEMRTKNNKKNLSNSLRLKSMLANQAHLNIPYNKRRNNTCNSKIPSLIKSNQFKIPIINQIIYNTEVDNLFLQMNNRQQQINLSSIDAKQKMHATKSYLLSINHIKKNRKKNRKYQAQQWPSIISQNYIVNCRALFNNKQRQKQSYKMYENTKKIHQMSLGQKNVNMKMAKFNEGIFYSNNDIVPWNFRHTRYKTDLEDIYVSDQ